MNKYADKLTNILSNQIEVLTELSSNLKVVRDALFKRNWINLEQIMRRNNPLVEEFEKLEYRREEVMENIAEELSESNNGDSEFFLQNFYSNISHKKRKNLEEMRREMKVLVNRIASLSEGIEFYVKTTAKTLGSILDELFPVRRGKIYSKSGKSSRPEDLPLVVNRTL